MDGWMDGWMDGSKAAVEAAAVALVVVLYSFSSLSFLYFFRVSSRLLGSSG